MTKKKKNKIVEKAMNTVNYFISKQEEVWNKLTTSEKLQKILNSNVDNESKEKWSFLFSLSEEVFEKCLGFRVDVSSLNLTEKEKKFVNVHDFSFEPLEPSTFSIFYEIRNRPLTDERKEKIRSHEKLHELLTTHSEDGDDLLQPSYELVVN